MAATALATYLLFLLLAFLWRGWLQGRRTGDHGFRGFSGPVGSAGWLGGCLVTFGGLAAFVAPVAELWGVAPATAAWLPTPVRAGGVALMVVGVMLTLIAQVQMGSSWRIGVDPTEATELVTTGLFARVRNPIFSAMLAALLGLALAVPNLIALSAFIASLAGIELQVRKVEEPHLLRTHGERYRSYAQRVGRFVPGVGLLE